MADLALLVLTLFWGTTFHFVKQALGGTSPGVFLVLRFAVATGAVGAVALWRRDPRTPGLVRHGLLLGAFMFGGFAFQTWGLRYTTPSHSAFLTGLAVLMVPFLSRALLKTKVPLSSWLGVSLAVGGLAALTRPFDGGVSAGVRLGDLLTLGCAVSYAFQVVYTGEWSARHPLALLTLTQIATTLAGSGILVALEPRSLSPAPQLAGVVLFTGLAMTAGAFFVQNWGQRHTSAVRAALIFSLEPVAAALFSHFYGGEPLGPSEWAGGSLIVLGVFVGELGSALAARRPPVVPA